MSGFRADRSVAEGRCTISACSIWRNTCGGKSCETLHEEIEAGTPIVGLEPSCVAAFRDEMVDLYPHRRRCQTVEGPDADAWASFSNPRLRTIELPQLHRKAIVHGHCHQKADHGNERGTKDLKRIGLDFQILDSGCCGMAGSFGFEDGDHYEVSINVGELVLLPAVRKGAERDLDHRRWIQLSRTDSQTTDRRGLHLAQAMQMALRDGQGSAPACRGGSIPSVVTSTRPTFHEPFTRKDAAVLFGAGALLLGGAAAWLLSRRRRFRRRLGRTPVYERLKHTEWDSGSCTPCYYHGPASLFIDEHLMPVAEVSDEMGRNWR